MADLALAPGTGASDSPGAPPTMHHGGGERVALRILKWLFYALVALLVLVLASVFVLTNTDWGRERVRRILVVVLEKSIHGIITLGKLNGNLLTGARMDGLSIRDSTGVPFLEADTVYARYSILSFVHERLYFDDVRLVHPLIEFDQPPGGTMNISRLFPTDTTKASDSTPGFGSWFALRHVTVVQGRARVQVPWSPPDSLGTGARRDSAIIAALAGKTRYVVVRRGTGYQSITIADSMNARLPLVRLTDPQYKWMLVEAAHLSAIAQPFTGEPVRVRDLAGQIAFDSDSAWFRNIRAVFPSSRLRGQGVYVNRTTAMTIQAHADTAAFADFRWAYPPFPDHGGGTLDLLIDLPGGKGEDLFAIRNANLAIDSSRAQGQLIFSIGDTVSFGDTRLTMQTFDTRVIQGLVPTLKMPRYGWLTGRLAMMGGFRDLHLDTDLRYDDGMGAGRSHVIAAGLIGFDTTMFRAQEFHVRLLPLQVALARTFDKTLPIGGTITGSALVNGDTRHELTFQEDLALDDRGAHSALTGGGLVRPAGKNSFVDVALRLHPLALATPGRFAPSIGLRGVASGPVVVRGNTSDLGIRSDLTTGDGGQIAARARVDVASKQIAYDAGITTHLFNTQYVVRKAPLTRLTARINARGRGTSPATMTLDARASVAASVYDSVRVDTLETHVTAANGLLQIPLLAARLRGATVDAQGSLGLRAGVPGELAYRVNIDSLAAFATYIPKDTGKVTPRPGRLAEAVRRAKADSTRRAEASELQRALHGGPAPKLVVDTPTAVPRDSIAGAAYIAGVLRGDITNFDARGRFGVERLAVLGNTVRLGQAEYAVVNGAMAPLTDKTKLVVATRMDSVVAGGLALDTVEARVAYQAHAGHAEVTLLQSGSREYSVATDVRLGPQYDQADISSLRIRLDTVVYASVGPSFVRWGGNGIQISHLDLRHGDLGRIYVDGRIPKTGDADVTADISNFEIGSLLTLAQSDLPLSGVVSAAARLQGTTDAPRIKGAFGGAGLRYSNGGLPDLRATIDYANRRLVTHAELLRQRDHRAELLADATLPANLAITNATGERFPDRDLVADVKLDSLSLYPLADFTQVLTKTFGIVSGEIHARGTRARPALTGYVNVDATRAHIVPLGLNLRDVVGRIRMLDTVVVVDSITGSTGGQLRIAGQVGVGDYRTPDVNLTLTAHNAKVIDNDVATLRADADIRTRGPINQLTVRGTTRIRQGTIQIPDNASGHASSLSASDPTVFAVVDTTIATQRELISEPSPLIKGIDANVTVSIDRDVWARSKDANVELFSDGDVNVRLPRGSENPMPLVSGTISTDRGQYTFLSKRFQITNGSATFTGSPTLNPLLQATAELLVPQQGSQNLTIRLLIGGSLDNLRLSVTSDAQPPISQSDLLGYLAFGQSTTSLVSSASSSGAASQSGGTGTGPVGQAAALAQTQLASVALGVVVDQIQTSTAKALNADVFYITPNPNVPAELFNVSRLSTLLASTQVEYGRFLSTHEYLGLDLVGTGTIVSGATYQLRGFNGFRLEARVDQRYYVTPSLNTGGFAQSHAFGTYLIREWRF